jgi:photosystem II stability/assembly factor-like uncharacterized protein
MQKQVALLPVLMLCAISLFSQQWYTTYAPHGRDVSASAVLGNNIVLGAGFEVAEQFEDYFISTDYGLGWNVAATQVPTSQVKSVAFADAFTGYAVCLNGKVVKTIDGGNVWLNTNTFTNRKFFKITYATSQVLFIAGGSQGRDSSAILKSTDGGATWVHVYAQPGPWLKAITFTDANNGVAVGDSSVVLRTTDGGASWQPVTTATNSRSFNDVVFASATTGFIIGGIRDSIRTILTTTNGGQTWSILKDEPGGGLNAATFIDANLGYIVGDSATVLKTTDGGANWVPQVIPGTDADQRIHTIAFGNAQFGVIAGIGGYVRIYANTAVPQAVTVSSQAIDTVNVTLVGRVNTRNIPGQCYFYISADSTFPYQGTTVWGSTLTNDSLAYYTATVNNLAPHTRYYYYLSVSNIAGTTRGDTLQFVADMPAYTFSSNGANNVTTTGAVLNGTIKGFHAPVTLGFSYGTTQAMANYITASPATVSDSLQHNITATVSNLQPHQLYYARMRGVSGGNLLLSTDFTFFTGAPYNVLQTMPATGVTDSTGVLNGFIQGAIGPLNMSFDYGTSPSFGNTVSATPSLVNSSAYQAVSLSLSNLQPFTTYYYRVRADMNGASFVGDTYSFFTGSSSYVFQTLPATGVSGFAATFNAQVDKFPTPVSLNFEYGTTPALGNSIPAQPATVTDTLAHTVSALVTSLSPATTYYYRLVGQTSGSPVYGQVLSFQTSVSASDFETLSATNVTANTAVLNATVQNIAVKTALSFEYGLTPAMGNSIAAVPDTINSMQQYLPTATLTGLQTNAVYYYRLKGATVTGQTYYGSTKQLYTGANPIPNWDFQYWRRDTFQLADAWNFIGDDFERVTGHSGNYALKINNGSVGVLGFINTSGNNPFVAGVPFHARPDSLIVYMNYNLITNDTGVVMLHLYDQANNDISTQFYKVAGNSGGLFKRMAFPVIYNSALTPDSIVVGFYCGVPEQSFPHPGDFMIIDDLSTVPNTQTIYNGNLENWFAYPHNTLLGWSYYGKHVMVSPANINVPSVVSQQYFSQPSDYAVQLTNRPLFGGWLMGEINNTDGNIGSKYGGFAVSARHLTLNGYYKWYPAAGDSMVIDIQMMKNGQGIGYAQFIQGDTVDVFTPFSLNINYDNNNDVPDTAILTIRACLIECKGASTLVLDKLSFDGFTGIEGEEYNQPLISVDGTKLYPNPANGSVVVELNQPASGKVNVMLVNLNGIKLAGVIMSEGEQKALLDVANIPAGFYVVQVVGNGKTVNHKLIIAR